MDHLDRVATQMLQGSKGEAKRLMASILAFLKLNAEQFKSMPKDFRKRLNASTMIISTVYECKTGKVVKIPLY